ncbi:hypothetical protein C8F04DRAFT_1306236 [Mycena alexandri]|uniref:Uncharacterized protein n=1 Tax=Mycena alexandri TaxID=1745969 RepID=A0AAD6S937_9AGAR|nr:hypothetical protein C8F04DRAFT_1306236 [Mycena alexandri]
MSNAAWAREIFLSFIPGFKTRKRTRPNNRSPLDVAGEYGGLELVGDAIPGTVSLHFHWVAFEMLFDYSTKRSLGKLRTQSGSLRSADPAGLIPEEALSSSCDLERRGLEGGEFTNPDPMGVRSAHHYQSSTILRIPAESSHITGVPEQILANPELLESLHIPENPQHSRGVRTNPERSECFRSPEIGDAGKLPAAPPSANLGV